MYYCKACSQPICPDIQHACVAALMGRGPCPSCSAKDARIALMEKVVEAYHQLHSGTYGRTIINGKCDCEGCKLARALDAKKGG